MAKGVSFGVLGFDVSARTQIGGECGARTARSHFYHPYSRCCASSRRYSDGYQLRLVDATGGRRSTYRSFVATSTTSHLET